MDYLAVAAAGFFGAVTRAMFSKVIKAVISTAFPVGTLVVNLSGSLALSFFMNLTLDRLKINPKLRLAVGTGFLGAYTTFSTFTAESVNLLRGHLPGLAFIYILATPVGCVLAAWFGALLSRKITGPGGIPGTSE